MYLWYTLCTDSSNSLTGCSTHWQCSICIDNISYIYYQCTLSIDSVFYALLVHSLYRQLTVVSAYHILIVSMCIDSAKYVWTLQSMYGLALYISILCLDSTLSIYIYIYIYVY